MVYFLPTPSYAMYSQPLNIFYLQFSLFYLNIICASLSRFLKAFILHPSPQMVPIYLFVYYTCFKFNTLP